MIFLQFFFGNTLTSINTLLDRPIIYKTVIILTNRTTTLGIFSGFKNKIIVDWSVGGNMNPDYIWDVVRKGRG